MKAKLLKKLRRDIYLVHIPSVGLYELRSKRFVLYNDCTFGNLSSAIRYKRLEILSYARQNYSNKRKEIRL